jgi:serine/threonine protein kinase
MAVPAVEQECCIMTGERWQEIRTVLEAAQPMDSEKRRAYLDQACASDQSLRREVESLLAADQQAQTGFLESPPLARKLEKGEFLEKPWVSASIAEEETQSWVGRRIGPYKVLEIIGEGGMGSVYRAARADEQYKKQVAIKVVKQGLNTPFALARFRAERQILANLEHPNIARMLDGGATEAGLPYVVMELMEGEPIDEYCESRKLSIEERLRLFRTICLAVQYAHQHMVIHRDLKPGNILVTAEGTPKLLDFGIAKILDPESFPGGAEATISLMRMLTPEYASPEQVRGETISTASDVYSLGVVLFVLLTGCRPFQFDNRSLDAIARVICDTEPQRPSTAVRRTAKAASGPDVQQGAGRRFSAALIDSPEKLSKRLRGDLDNIVLMALRKDPRRRYASAEQLAEDIRRHLEDLPVMARKDTAGYRVSKFIMRHKAGSAAAAATAALLVAALFVTLHEASVARLQAQIANQQAQIAREQKAKAEKRFNDVRRLANSLMFEIHDSIRDLPGATKARELLVQRALEYLDGLSQESADPALQREIAAAYERIGDVQGFTGVANLEDFAGASASYAKAVAIRESLAAANPSDLSLRSELVQEYFKVSFALMNSGDFDGELRVLQRVRPLVNTLSSENNDRQFRMTRMYYFTAMALEKTGDFGGALENYQQAASTLEPIAAQPQSGAIRRAYVAEHYNGIAKMLARVGRTDEAVARAAKARTMLQKLLAVDPKNATFLGYLGESYDASVDVLATKGDLDAALRSARQELAIYQQLVFADPSNQMARADIGWSDVNIGEVLLRQNKPTEALQPIRDALANFRKSNQSKGFWYAVEMGQAYLDLGKVYAALAERASSPDEKRRLWREARSQLQESLRARSASPGRLDANGRDQMSEIRGQLARCDVAMLARPR